LVWLIIILTLSDTIWNTVKCETFFMTWSAILPGQWVNYNAKWIRGNNPTEWSVLSSHYT
jgi:hypothetical protein